MKNSKRIVALLLAVTMVFIAACGTKPAEPKPAEPAKPEVKEETDTAKTDSIEITFMIPEWGAPSQEMLDDFEAKENIKVNLETVVGTISQ